MLKSILEVEEGLKADLVRVFSIFSLPFALYYVYLDMQYKNAILSHALPYGDYILSHMDDFKLMAFTALTGSVGVLVGPILARMRLAFTFGKQIKQLTGKLSSARADTSFHLMYIQRYKQMSKVITDTMEYVEHSADNTPFEVQQELMMIIKGIAEELSKGLCTNLQKETLNVRQMLDQTQSHFTDYIQNHNVQIKITCPEDLTVVGDSLFMRLIFLNILGLPICSTQNNGAISVFVSQKEGYAHIEIHDHRTMLTTAGQQHLKFPREFLAKTHELKQLCFQNDWGYAFKEKKKGTFYTKVSVPLKAYDTVENHGVNFVPAGVSSLH